MKKSLCASARGRFFFALILILAPLIAAGQKEARPDSLHSIVLDGVKVTFSVPRPLTPQLAADGKTVFNAVPARVYIARPVSPSVPVRIPSPVMVAGVESEAAASTFAITYIPSGEKDIFGKECLAFPAEARAAIEAAAKIWGNLIQSTVPIAIKLGWADMAGLTISYSGGGYISRDFSGAPKAATWYEASLANALHGSDLYTDNHDIHITYNKNFAWYFGTDGNTPWDKIDLMTVVLHEIAHGFNFGGSMDYSAGTGSWGLYGYPNIYDTFLRDESGNALTNTAVYANPSTALGSALTSNSLWFHGSNAVFANNGQRVKMYAPAKWSPGTSNVHLDYTTYVSSTDSLMVHTFPSGYSMHNPGPVTKGLLTDLGWMFADRSFKAVTAFNFAGLTPTVNGVINEGAHTVTLNVPFGTDVTALAPTIAFSGISVSPASGVAQNFTSPVTYTVTAADASLQVYTVTVNIASVSSKTMTAFNFNGLIPAVGGIINEGTQAVTLSVPYGTNVTALVPTISIIGSSVSPASGVAQNFTTPVIYTVTAADASTQAYTVTVTIAPYIALSRTSANFGTQRNGTPTPAETVIISNAGSGPLSWTATRSADWISVSPTSGVGAGTISIGIARTDLDAGQYAGTISVSAPNATNSPVTININLKVVPQGTDNPPFGVFDTPLEGAKVASSIPVTGWVLDDIGMQSVKIYRGTNVSDRVYIGDAVFVEGARPDVGWAYPGYPQNTRAGWGYMLLTNFLPNGGNGTFTLLAYATDLTGREVLLGSKTILCDNANAVRPFGAIDTPTQGGTASGAIFNNFGWALTPLPNSIPTDGSTLKVWIDGLPLAGHPTYNHYRQDIADQFPGYLNAAGAIGLYPLNTTTFTNAVHTIEWSVQDSAGNADGIGSRYFSIQNTAGGSSPTASGRTIEDIEGMPEDFRTSVFVRWGVAADHPAEFVLPEMDGSIRIRIPEVTRVAVYLNEKDAVEREEETISRGERIRNRTSGASPAARYEAYALVLGELRPLPIGASFDARDGVLYWQPGPGFLGDYPFVILDSEGMTRRTIKITIFPQGDSQK